MATLLTVGTGLAVFFASDYATPKEYLLTFSDERDPARITTIQGIPFSVSEGRVSITEPLAHLRLPFGRPVAGKRLLLNTRFRLENGETLAVGLKQGEFWLDYDRQILAKNPAANWTERELAFDVNRAYLADDGSLELMFFIEERQNRPLLHLDELRVRITPGPVRVKVLAERLREQLIRLLRRPPARTAGLSP